ncbi:Nuclear transport factor 2 [Clonorchis sinensis]|uniref:Nuclear transport factor 2 n=1 Tax=Clonorchis sinensis TaxID=79923 RepID=A0A8T1M2N5_CLOSI|nr:Nuclear transport factor 2 [Clonorchis sinensis]
MQAVQPSADEIGKQFAAQYYQTLQTSRPAIRNFYHEQARMIYEGDEVVGRENIAQKLQNIKCNTLQFALSSVDAQPCGNAILILVCGQLQSDEDRPLPFSETFLLTPIDSSLLVCNSMFRLNLHHF